MYKCAFQETSFTGTLFNIVATETTLMKSCTFIDTYVENGHYGGLGMKATDCEEVHILNDYYENVGTTKSECGISRISYTHELFSCINCTCVRCYARDNSCCFLQFHFRFRHFGLFFWLFVQWVLFERCWQLVSIRLCNQSIFIF